MALLALLFSLFVTTVGVIGLVSPARLFHIVQRFQSSAVLYVAAGFRVVFGASLFFAAPSSRAPEAILMVGIVVFVSGLVTPFFGIERFRRILNWWSARGPVIKRVWAGVALALGLLCAYAVTP